MGHLTKHAGDLIGTLRQVRSRLDSCLMEKGDPTKAYQDAALMLEAAGGEVGELRRYAAGLGELWDTMLAVMRLAGEAYAAGGQYRGDEGDAGVSSDWQGCTAHPTPANGGTPADDEDFPAVDPTD